MPASSPRKYKVVFHNDDYTTQEFVVLVLMRFFHKDETEATHIMLSVHHKGSAVAGVYSRDIAETKVVQVTDFAREENRNAMEEALREVAGRMGRKYPLVIDGRDVETPQVIERLNPSHRYQVVGRCGRATPEHARQALDAAHDAFPAWRDTPAKERADYLFRVAEIMRRRRFELAAWEVYECGKPWRESDADVGHDGIPRARPDQRHRDVGREGAVVDREHHLVADQLDHPTAAFGDVLVGERLEAVDDLGEIVRRERLAHGREAHQIGEADRDSAVRGRRRGRGARRTAQAAGGGPDPGARP